MTGLLATSGSQFADWSAAYRLFSKQRLPVEALFSVVRRSISSSLPDNAPFCAAIDDTLLRRGGRATPGSSWRRDPFSPPFQTNLVRAQRFLQLSAALSGHEQRMTPIAFLHAPSVAKPRPNAPLSEHSRYRSLTRQSGLSALAASQIQSLRLHLDNDNVTRSQRSLCVTFDGGYTNSTLLKRIPPRTTCIGRLRKDARLYFPPLHNPARGRRLSYGEPAPTPEQLRTDDAYPWQRLSVTHSGVSFAIRFKSLSPVLWRTAGAKLRLQIVVIAPLKYRLRKNSRLLYRDPAYLVCTDPHMAPADVVRTYLKRWDIEVNFRDEKTLLGVGQAQVRNQHSVESAPALAVAAYSLLLMAATNAFGATPEGLLPRPKWDDKPTQRLSTQRLIQQLRAEVWGLGLGVTDFSAFASHNTSNTKGEKCEFPLASAVFYANG